MSPWAQMVLVIMAVISAFAILATTAMAVAQYIDERRERLFEEEIEDDKSAGV